MPLKKVPLKRPFVILGSLGLILLLSSSAFFYGAKNESAYSELPSAVVSARAGHEVQLVTAPEVNPLLASYCKSAYEVTCETPWQTRDPTGSVASDLSGEIRAFRLLREVIRDHPEMTSTEIEEELVNRIYIPRRRKRLEDAFVWAKQEVWNIIEKQNEDVFSAEQKNMLLRRVDEVKLDLPPPASNYADASDLFTKNEIYFERTADLLTRVRVGGAYLINTSSFYNLAFTFAHEIAHSIDPCELSQLETLPQAYQQVLNCFVDQKWTLTNKLQCGRSDEISEVFADWMASQVIARALQLNSSEYSVEEKIYSAVNSVRDLCEQPVVGAKPRYNNHQIPKIRIDKVLGSNPDLRQVLSCASPNPQTYCHFDYQGPLP